ncbi:MAG: o-succinylbenzoate synthase [Nocardioides sp.]|uniref:o-succinylbenzoate synthase n=1 Tax=Nocardioides sp. TaxID=35761 RepID=UPI0039E395C6
MKLHRVELLRLRMPLVAPFRTAYGIETERDVLLIRANLDDTVGWAECTAPERPAFSAEYQQGAYEVIVRHLLPRLFAAHDLTAARVHPALATVSGHPMAKAALESAVLDAQLRRSGMRMADYLGGIRERVPAGVSIGIPESLGALLESVAGYLDAGYRRVKLKIEPGWDLVPVRAVRERYPDLSLQVDANTSYAQSDVRRLVELDQFDLQLLEQPLAADDLPGHARLARRLRTPVCLDESIASARMAAAAIDLGACSVVNIKAARVGGYLEARRVHDVCSASGIPVWCGGMLETGVGRAANVALASLPGFVLPGDISASDRYWVTDLTEPFVLDNEAHLPVPVAPGIGVEPDPAILADLTVHRETFTP